MEEIDVNRSLAQEDLLILFKSQLRKDIESAGIHCDPPESLPSDLDSLKGLILSLIQPLMKSNSTLLSSLLYRVDISEKQLRDYQEKHKMLPFDEIVAELIIKRVLQKVILKRSFSK